EASDWADHAQAIFAPSSIAPAAPANGESAPRPPSRFSANGEFPARVHLPYGQSRIRPAT
ncbi:hypothetical protein, partial [Rhizorhabdus histidinilytica]|uniref:hypothetical protein n=1 Tax=Rhizorhabdus histidinilytica TaxID=439228 RepID=UPI001C37745E